MGLVWVGEHMGDGMLVIIQLEHPIISLLKPLVTQ